jgi:hypothetical protein
VKQPPVFLNLKEDGMPLHDALTGSELHENKGVASASDNTVASATSGATVWRKVNSSMIDTTSIFGVNKVYLCLDIVDVSTAETVYFYVPFAGTLTKINTILQGAITVADSTLTVRNNAGTSMGTITVANAGSAAGDLDSLTPGANNTFTAGQTGRISTDGASTTAARLLVLLEFTVTG